MKICENGVIREMTVEEIAEMQEMEIAAESTIEPRGGMTMCDTIEVVDALDSDSATSFNIF